MKIKFKTGILFIIVMFGYFTDSICFQIDSLHSTSGMGLDFSINPYNSIRLNIYGHFYDLAVKPIEIETSILSLGFCHERFWRVALGNILFSEVAVAPSFFGIPGFFGDNDFWGFGKIGFWFMLPQTLGNLKVHLPIIKDHIHIFVGDATDYYVRGKESSIYFESKAGIKLALFNFALEASICKPWLKGYMKSDEPYISLHIGRYFSRKFAEKAKTNEQLISNAECDKPGPFTITTKGGKLRVTGNMINNKIDGTITIFSSSGPVLAIMNYKEGIKNGEFKLWYHPDNGGRLKLIANYVNDTITGIKESWFPDGKPRGRYTYDNGKLLTAQAYDQYGKLLSEPLARSAARNDMQRDIILYMRWKKMVTDVLPKCK